LAGDERIEDMTQTQESHLTRTINLFTAMADFKYRKVAEEHGGDLKDMTALWLIDAALDETIDQFVYLSTIREKLLAGEDKTK
jgi:cytidylate kinase